MNDQNKESKQVLNWYLTMSIQPANKEHPSKANININKTFRKTSFNKITYIYEISSTVLQNLNYYFHKG